MTGINAELIQPADPRWRRFLGRVRHDTYHLPEYVTCAAAHEGGTPIAFYAEAPGGAVLVPLLLRKLPEHLDAPSDWRDATSPYGYPGPLASESVDHATITQCLEACRDVGRAHGIVSAFIRLHPLLSPTEALAASGEVHHGGPVVFMDLAQPAERSWAAMRSNHRNGIKKLRRAGFTGVMDAWDRYGDFIRVYRQTMVRARADEFYFFSDGYFQDLRRALGDRLRLCAVLASDGSLAAAGLFFATGHILQYHLGGTADEVLSQAPSKLIFDVARLWGTAQGLQILHLGGGLGGQSDSLFHFKAGFSPHRAEFATCRMVLDPERYEYLVQRTSDGESTPTDSGYFPAYRRPLTVVRS